MLASAASSSARRISGTAIRRRPPPPSWASSAAPRPGPSVRRPPPPPPFRTKKTASSSSGDAPPPAVRQMIVRSLPSTSVPLPEGTASSPLPPGTDPDAASSSLLPRVSLSDCKSFFDELAPFWSARKILKLRTELRNFATGTTIRSLTWMRHVNATFLEHDPWLVTALLKFLNGTTRTGGGRSIPPDPDVLSSEEALVALGTVDEAAVAAAGSERSWMDPCWTLSDDPRYPANVNARAAEELRAIQIVASARDRLVLSSVPVWWFRPKRKNMATPAGEREEDAARAAAVEEYRRKSAHVRRREAQEFVGKLARSLSACQFREAIVWFSDIATGLSGVDESNNDGASTGAADGEMHSLSDSVFSHLTNSHLHLVAHDVADFFCVTIPETGDPRLDDARRDWNLMRDGLSEILLAAQHRYVEIPPWFTLSKQTARRVTDNYAMRKLELLRTRPDGSVISRGTRDHPSGSSKNRGRPHTGRKVHVRFDAMPLGGHRVEAAAAADGLASRMVFLDNLPVDVDEEELADIYGRCGAIDDVKVFNRRPELDPGPAALKTMKKVPKSERRWLRLKARGNQKTPVYGAVVYHNKSGRDAALNDHLRIFGMVLRKHAMRSVPSEEMSTLYIENIPRGFHCLDLEHNLSKVLHPDLYICLDIADNDYAQPTSCEIHFPNHDFAMFAFERLQKVDMGSDECVMNWVRTPKNAMDFWTREIDMYS